MQTIGNMHTVRAQVMLAGYRSLAAWAKAHGYLPVTVRRVIYDWGQRPEQPHGGIGRQVMRDLKKTLGVREAA